MQTEVTSETSTKRAKATKADPVTLRSEAAKALRGARNNPDDAYDALWDKITNDMALYRALADEMVQKAIKTEIFSLLSEQRNATLKVHRTANAAPIGTEAHAASLRIVAAVEERRLLDMPLVGRKTLGECTGIDLDTAIQRRTAIVSTIGRNRAFLVAVRQRVADNTRCADTFDETELKQVLANTDASFDAEELSIAALRSDATA